MGNTLTDTLTSLLNTRSVRQTLSLAEGFRSRFGFHWWYLPLAVLLLAVVGLSTESYLESSVRRQKATELETLLNAEVTALQVWLESQKAYTSVVASDPIVRSLVLELLDLAVEREGVSSRLLASSALAQLREYLRPLARAHGYIDFVVTSSRGTVLASTIDQAVGNVSLTRHAQFLAPALGGLVMVSRPFRAEVPLPDASGQPAWGRPTMFVAAPVRSPNGEIVAALGLRIRPEVDFTRILHVARPGESGETYAFDVDALMVSQSRFDQALREIGLLPEDPSVRAIFNVEIRDPGGDMTRGYRPKVPRSRQPLTRMAEEATAGNSGVDVEGYRDYRGVPVIGAWTWMADSGFGVVTEIDVQEAFAMLRRLRLLFRGLLGLLSLAAVGTIAATVVISRVGSRADAAMARARRLGQYTLERKIGAGGMGEVYEASHAMLRRPTAIKLLLPGRGGAAALTRFEREVQITSQLTHPNTVAIYDYGRTPNGLFYYAMEYLPGLSVERLVEVAGPLPAGRVIHLLRQMCGSLAEAHAAGLVHRDIKPANVIVCERGGVQDVAKVLDFGIVYDPSEVDSNTEAGFMGSPLYMSPESIREDATVDARSDIYSLGALAYFMLVGEAPFEGGSALEICTRHLHEAPAAPSSRALTVPLDLEQIVLACLTKKPEERPPDMAELAARFDECADAGRWMPADAIAWWAAHASNVEDTEDSKAAGVGRLDVAR